jgi:hypothetical protein
MTRRNVRSEVCRAGVRGEGSLRGSTGTELMLPRALRCPSGWGALAAGCVLLAAGQASGQGMAPLFGGELNNPTGDQAFVAPVTSPYYNENSFIVSDARAWFVYHKFNAESLGADTNATVAALQIRVALTDRLQLVAYKDGYLDIDGGPATEGWNDVAAGLKYQFLHDSENQMYAAAGLGYEFRTGESRALQNDSEARGWVSVDKGWDKFHAGATLNYRMSTSDENDDNGNSDVVSWHARADYRLTDYFSPVAEVNGYHVITDSGTGVALNGADVLNLGATDADATVTAALGVEFRTGPDIAIRFAYEVPLTTNDSDLFGSRITFSIVYPF